jgi:hypothetical protein
MSEAFKEEVDDNITAEKLIYSDKELLDFLQELNDQCSYTGNCALRMSTTGRGWRLHETSSPGFKNVREAISFFMDGGRRL